MQRDDADIWLLGRVELDELNWMGWLEISSLPFPNIIDTTRMIDECDAPFIHLLCLLNDFQYLPKRCKAGKRWWNYQDAMLDRHIPRSCSKCGSCRILIDEYRTCFMCSYLSTVHLIMVNLWFVRSGSPPCESCRKQNMLQESAWTLRSPTENTRVFAVHVKAHNNWTVYNFL